MSSKALTDKILRTAENEALEMAREIKKRADESEGLIVSAAEADRERIISQANEKAEATVKAASLVAGLDSRKALLHAKREVVDAAFSGALDKLCAMPEGEMKAYLCSLIKKFAPEAEIEIKVTEKCRALFDAETVAELEASLKERFGTEAKVKLSGENGNFRGGVYMVGTKVDLDASFEAILRDLRSGCEAEIASILFPQ